MLEAWQRVCVWVQVQREEGEIGDVYETIVVTYTPVPPSIEKGGKMYVGVEVAWLRPKVKVAFGGEARGVALGSSMVSLAKLPKNSLGEHSITITMEQP